MRTLPPHVVVVLLLVTACQGWNEDDLPPVPRPAIFDAPSPCVAAPPLSPLVAPAEHPTEPQLCFPESWAGRDVMAMLTVVDGQVTGLTFDSGCDADPDVDPAVKECVQSRLAAWRYRVEPCAARESVSHVPLLMRPGVPDASGIASGINAPGAWGW